ncbi:MAG: Hsp20/alpha crystallin family protein [Deltaproteobacteria bacterium]
MKTTTERKILPYKKEHLPVKGEDIEPFSLLRREIDRLFEDFTRGFVLEPFRRIEERLRQYTPVVDVSESEKEITVNVELPGMDEKDVEVSLTDGHLMIRGEKKEEKEEKKKGYYRTERSFGEFNRVIPVPTGVDTNKVSAVFKKGLLSITMPKTEEAQTTVKKIPIKSD